MCCSSSWDSRDARAAADDVDGSSSVGWTSEDEEDPPLSREATPPHERSTSRRGAPRLAVDSSRYERDASGRMVYAPRGFYYDGVMPDDEGERIKVEVGVVGARQKRTFVLRKVLSSSSSSSGSDILEVTMERPLGITFERDTEGMVRVADFVEGSRAGRAAAVERLQGVNNAGQRAAAKRGDVLIAFTTTTLSFGPRAQLLGDLSGTKRVVVLFGADRQPWSKVVSALKAGLVADGPVTLLLERERDRERAIAWMPEELPPPSPNSVRSQKDVGGSADGARGATAGAGGGTAGGRRRVEDDTNVPDAINGAFFVSGISFLLLILAGFNP